MNSAKRLTASAAFALLLLFPHPVPGEPIAVRFVEGSVQGFLALRTTDGKLLASGDLTQVVHGEHVISHLVFHFKDGSVDDETADFTQHGSFRLISDRHIQKGPIFPKPMDVQVDAASGKVTVRYKDQGREKVEMDQMDLPDDLANGVILNMLKNIPPNAKETKVSWLAATPKPRLVKLSVTPEGETTFRVSGFLHKATRFDLKVEIGGVAGIIAPLVGKEPAHIEVWIAGGAAPAFVKSEGPQYLGGPIWRIELTSPVWPR